MSKLPFLKNGPVYFGGPYMHEARKVFNTPREAVEAATNSSFSLFCSDVHVLSADTLEEAFENVNNYTIDDEEWNPPSVGVTYSYDNDDGIMEHDEEEKPNAIFYQTSSGINQLTIRKIEGEGDSEPKYEAIYRVESQNPFQESSAMKSFEEGGWDCRCIAATREVLREEKNIIPVDLTGPHNMAFCLDGAPKNIFENLPTNWRNKLSASLKVPVSNPGEPNQYDYETYMQMMKKLISKIVGRDDFDLIKLEPIYYRSKETMGINPDFGYRAIEGNDSPVILTSNMHGGMFGIKKNPETGRYDGELEETHNIEAIPAAEERINCSWYETVVEMPPSEELLQEIAKRIEAKNAQQSFKKLETLRAEKQRLERQEETIKTAEELVEAKEIKVQNLMNKGD